MISERFKTSRCVHLLGVMVLSLVSASAAHAIDQTLGGAALLDSLRVTVRDDGSMNVERYDTATFIPQIAGGANKGTFVMANGIPCGFGFFSTANATPVSNSTMGDTITTIIDCSAGFQWKQEVTYYTGTRCLFYRWTLTPSITIPSVNLFHGQNSALPNINFQPEQGFYSTASRALGVFILDGSRVLTSSLHSSTTPTAFRTGDTNDVFNGVILGDLNDGSISAPNVDVTSDNGYAFQWSASLSGGSPFVIEASERFAEGVAASNTLVMAPACERIVSGGSSTLAFPVTNLISNSNNIGYTATSSNPNWTVNGSGSQLLGPFQQMDFSAAVSTGFEPVGSFTVVTMNAGTARDSADVIVSAPHPNAPTIISPALGDVLNGTVGLPFSFIPSLGSQPVDTFAVSPSLPPGLTLDSITGQISGTPTLSGSFFLGYSASNSFGIASVPIVFFAAQGEPEIPPTVTVPRLVSIGRNVTIQGGAFPSAIVTVMLDGATVGTVTAASNSAAVPGAWSISLGADLPLGVHRLNVIAVDPYNRTTSLPSEMPFTVTGGAILDYSGDGLTDLNSYSVFGTSLNHRSVDKIVDKISISVIPGTVPAPGDYDGDKIWDPAAIRRSGSDLVWAILMSSQSSSGSVPEVVFGAKGDTVLTGCRFVDAGKTSLAILNDRTISAARPDFPKTILNSAVLPQGARAVGCVDTDSDGIDEVVLRSTTSDGTREKISVVTFTQGTVVTSFETKRFFKAYVIPGLRGNGGSIAIIRQPARKRVNLSLHSLNGTVLLETLRVPAAGILSSALTLDEAGTGLVGFAVFDPGKRQVSVYNLDSPSVGRRFSSIPAGNKLIQPQYVYRTR